MGLMSKSCNKCKFKEFSEVEVRKVREVQVRKRIQRDMSHINVIKLQASQIVFFAVFHLFFRVKALRMSVLKPDLFLPS